jgi:predicted RecB family nuclease
MTTPQKKTITPEIVIAYTQCPHKAFLLLNASDHGAPNDYIQLFTRKKNAVRQQYITKLQKSDDVMFNSPISQPFKHAFEVNARLCAQQYVIVENLLLQVVGKSCWGAYQYVPIIFGGHCTVTSSDLIEILFVGYVIGLIQQTCSTYGYIVGIDGKKHKVSLDTNEKYLSQVLETLQKWVIEGVSVEPELLLTKQCGYCCFEPRCKSQAICDDHLSLLDSISTSKMLKKYEKKGIFTVKQLSYLYKPRKRKKHARRTLRHSVELQALALRTDKIYVQQLPALSRQSTEIFLDIEGIPEEGRYYLLGLFVCSEEAQQYIPFWSDTSHDEKVMWECFCKKLQDYPRSPIYHYGSYDFKAIERLAERYNDGHIPFKNQFINVITCIYGKIYFPVYSNRLKDVGKYLGSSWTSPQASGLQSLVWRYLWEDTQDTAYREHLLIYNREDCEALRYLVEKLSLIQQSAETLSEIDFAQEPKKYSTDFGKQVHHEFCGILKFAHADYENKKIHFSEKASPKETVEKSQRSSRQYAIIGKHVTRKVVVPPRPCCPNCWQSPLKPTEFKVAQVHINLVTTQNGIRKSVTKHVSVKGLCKNCGQYFLPDGMTTKGRPNIYGHGMKAWVVYQRVGLRMPYNAILELLEEQFNHQISTGSISSFLKEFGQYYATTEKVMMQRLLMSSFIHVDETSINIRGINHYVWVFTNGQYVILKYSETREATIVHDLLKTYQGVLISDFYPGYDSVSCRQQKCWVHLIRELNEDLWKYPFDVEYEAFVRDVRDLIVPIMKTVRKYGLKKRHFNKFKKHINQFYERVINGRYYRSELVLKYQNRFQRYRQSLFVFLEGDDISWHNNRAENALRHITIQEKISGFFHKTVIEEYLILLSIRQTCRFLGMSFFKFLYSSQTNIDVFG